MSRPLLDVNVLLALAWPNHQFHERARRWFASTAHKGWSSCAVTQLGFVRLSSNPAFTPAAKRPLEATLVLEQLVSHKGHHYLGALPPPAGPPFRDLVVRALGHQQVTDAYLLGVAIRHQVPLATFDTRIKSLAPSPKAVLEIR